MILPIHNIVPIFDLRKGFDPAQDMDQLFTDKFKHHRWSSPLIHQGSIVVVTYMISKFFKGADPAKSCIGFNLLWIGVLLGEDSGTNNE